MKNGVSLTGEQMGVTVEYRNPSTGDLADMARIIEQAAASQPDGIITRLRILTCCPVPFVRRSTKASMSSS